MKRSTLIAVCASSALLIGAAAFTLHPWSTTAPAHAAEMQPAEVDALLVRTVMARAGLAPEALAAAGISAQSAAVITIGAYTHLATTHTAWRTTIEDLAEARQRIDQLTQRIRRGEREYLGDLAQAKADLAEAQDIETNLLHQLRTTIGTNISQAQWQTIARFHTNRRTLSIPAIYAGVEWDGGSWKAARTAIHAVRSAQRQGIAPCQDAVAIVAALENDGQLAQCINNVQAVAPAIAHAIEQQLVNLQLH